MEHDELSRAQVLDIYYYIELKFFVAKLIYESEGSEYDSDDA